MNERPLSDEESILTQASRKFGKGSFLPNPSGIYVNAYHRVSSTFSMSAPASERNLEIMRCRWCATPNSPIM